MFSVNNFYDYLSHKYHQTKKSINILNYFDIDGDRNLFNVKYNHHNNGHLLRLYGALFLFDQEPFNFDDYYFGEKKPDSYFKMQTEMPYSKDLVISYLSRMHTPIICHSEQRSNSIKTFNDRGFLDVHYWYHGLIARDWFRHWKHYNTEHNSDARRFGLYVRDMSGSREYRKDLLKELHDVNMYCPFNNGEEFDSTESARITWDDTSKFNIQIVAETLFDTEKVHLTEKIFKPIVMGQPFILFGGRGGLRYLRSYGFKTFGHIWNEEYDDILDPIERFNQATKIIKRINKLPADRYKKVLEEAKAITEYNRGYFFSDDFERKLLNELHSNFDIALQQQEENYLTDPGGTWFKNLNTLINQNQKQYISSKQVYHILNYLKENESNNYLRIIKQYPWVNSL